MIPTTTSPPLPRSRQWWQRIKTSLVILFIAIFAFYGLLAMDASKVILATIGNDKALTAAVQIQDSAESGAVTERMSEFDVTWVRLMASATSSQYAYSKGSVWDTAIHYVSMPSANKVILALHMALSGLCMVLGAFQFWPALRRQRPKLHRRMGLTYVIGTQISMLFAMTYLLMTPVADIYSTLVFTVGLWVLAITVTLTLWLAMYHVIRREIAQHQVWMALNFGLLLTAPLLRYDWTLLGLAFPELSQSETNLSTMVFLIPQSFLLGYVLLCINRWLQKDRREPQRLALTAYTHRLFPYWSPVVLLMLVAAGWSTLQHYLLTPGMAGSAQAIALVPSSVVALEAKVLQPAIEARSIFTASALLVFMTAAVFLFAAFRREGPPDVVQQVRIRKLGLLLALGTAVNALIQLQWGYALGAPSHLKSAGGTFYMLDGLIAASFALALSWATVTGRLALIKEWGIFSILSVMATPAFYAGLAGLTLIGVPAVYVAGGHAYMIAAIGGSTLLLLGFAYSAYGSATRAKVAH